MKYDVNVFKNTKNLLKPCYDLIVILYDYFYFSVIFILERTHLHVIKYGIRDL